MSTPKRCLTVCLGFALCMAVVWGATANLAGAQKDEAEPAPAASKKEVNRSADTGEQYWVVDPKNMDPKKAWDVYFATGKLGKFHERLHYFLGDWNVECQMTMSFPGMEPSAPTQGKATYSWLMEGRWLTGRFNGVMMGGPSEHVSIIGFDNHRKKYVGSWYSSTDTAMATASGAISKNGRQIDLYFQLDEPGTGEIGKNALAAYRIIDDDTFAIDIHDLAIAGQKNKVFQLTYKRQK